MSHLPVVRRDKPITLLLITARAIASHFLGRDDKPFYHDEFYQSSTCRCARQAAPKMRCDCPVITARLLGLPGRQLKLLAESRGFWQVFRPCEASMGS